MIRFANSESEHVTDGERWWCGCGRRCGLCGPATCGSPRITASAAINPSPGYVGKAWGSPKTITGYETWGSNDYGYEYYVGTGETVTLSLLGSSKNRTIDAQK